MQCKTSTPSVWEEKTGAWLFDYGQLGHEITVDVAVIGGGITGLTTALMLENSGKRVAVIEAAKIGKGVTGFNSGHLTSLLLDMHYATIHKNFGAEKTKLVAESQIYAIQLIAQLVEKLNIECDFKFIPGYLYAEQEKQLDALYEEQEAALRAGIENEITDKIPLPFKIHKALRVSKQARFHPLKYVHALAHHVYNQGVQVYEESPVVEIDNKNKVIKTQSGTVYADTIVLATHTPVGFVPSVQTRLKPIRSYIIGVKIADSIEDALYWDMEDPYHYMRLIEGDKGQPLVIIGGEDHATGEEKETHTCFDRLEAYARDHYNVISIDYRWSAQLYDPADGLPYIGKISSDPDIYVGTGYTGEGLTGGTYAGIIISDLIRGIENPWADIYSPDRIKPLASAAGFVSDNLATLGHFVGDRLKAREEIDFQNLRAGEGKILNQDGKKVAAYKDDEGQVHCTSPVCTHMGCIVAWNEVEKSWDCPCHGGRFDATGHVLNGPPIKDLEKII